MQERWIGRTSFSALGDSREKGNWGRRGAGMRPVCPLSVEGHLPTPRMVYIPVNSVASGIRQRKAGF